MRECSPPTMCYMSIVMCHMSHSTCHVSCVTSHKSQIFFYKVVVLIGGGSVINGAYPGRLIYYLSCLEYLKICFDMKLLHSPKPFSIITKTHSKLMNNYVNTLLLTERATFVNVMGTMFTVQFTVHNSKRYHI